MTWVLIVGFMSAYRGGITTAEFSTQQTCEAAKASVYEEYSKANGTPFSNGKFGFFAICAEK